MAVLIAWPRSPRITPGAGALLVELPLEAKVAGFCGRSVKSQEIFLLKLQHILNNPRWTSGVREGNEYIFDRDRVNALVQHGGQHRTNLGDLVP
jgi:hypothetical protein